MNAQFFRGLSFSAFFLGVPGVLAVRPAFVLHRPFDHRKQNVPELSSGTFSRFQ